PVVECRWMPDRADRADTVHVAVREARWFGAALLVRVGDAAREADMTGLWAALSSADVPMALVLSLDQVEMACAAAPLEPLVMQMEGTTIEQREALWQTLL